MIIDYSILEKYTVEELDRLHDQIGMGREWALSESRRLLKNRENLEIDIVMGLADNKFGIPIRAQAAKLIQEDRGEVSASLEHDREIHDPKEILWSDKETD